MGAEGEKTQVTASIHSTSFTPNPLQKQFIESRAYADLFSSRMGEGKSTALAWSAFYHTRHNPGATWAVIRDTWENMQATTMKTFFDWFPPGIYGTFSATKKTFTWAEGVAKGEVEFLGMDDPGDASKLMSRELAGIAIDEPAPAVGSAGVDEMIFDIGMSRLRQPGMTWYGCKLAENNPDEAHWSYKRFVLDADPRFRVWQPSQPENIANLPPDYYASLRQLWRHRPDLVRRFVEGEFGFQQIGKSVTPQWSDRNHLGIGLIPVRGVPLTLCWDWGLTPTALITQKTPLGAWLILESFVGDGIGAEELIVDAVRPVLAERYPKYGWSHTGDPMGAQREQSSSARTAVGVMKKALGGTWRPGPSKLYERIEPLRSVLARMHNGKGLVQVDKFRAAEVWHALRGGWHFNITRTGIVGGEPVKDIHSHPGDAASYGAALLFPLRAIGVQKKLGREPQAASYFEVPNGGSKTFSIGPGVRAVPLPAHGDKL